MVKKLANISLTFLLLATTTGFTISSHYCGSNVVSISIDKSPKSCCDNEKGNCCHNESEHFQLKEDFIAPDIGFDFKLSIPIDLGFIPFFPLNNIIQTGCSEDLIYYTDTPSPPKIQNVLSRLQTYLL